ncbi:MAG TPA: class I SAM-dependent RNA methyltransferase [Bacteroidetes bacterium]|nr:class I SAM-dependent RNA methyltransferase [Bacteroidota bacterium]
MNVYSLEDKQFPMVATTFQGLEGILAEEVMRLGGIEIREKSRAVTFRGNKKLLYAANYHLRTALRILRVIAEFQVTDEKILYNTLYDLPWETFFTNHQKFVVDAVIHSPYFKHSHFIEQRVKDAVVDHFRDKTGSRPGVDKESPDIRLNIQISGKKCVLSMDSSGDSLHKRGYRVRHGLASLNEVLAAGMIMLSGWQGNMPFIDPMCGSGTLPIEAAMFAMNIPPGFMRNKYAFIKWKDYDATLYQVIKNIYTGGRQSSRSLILGCDRSAVAIRLARLNIINAGLEEIVKLKIMPMQHLTVPPGKPGIIMTDPPFGKRMRPRDMENIYRSIGNVLKNNFPGYDAWILSSNNHTFKWIGMRPSKQYELNHGGLKVFLKKFHFRERYYPQNTSNRQIK